ILQNYSALDELSLYVNENQYISECLTYIAFKETVSSLAANKNFDLVNYSEFLAMSKNVKEKAGTGSEPFPGEFLKLMKKNISLSQKILVLLIEYYYNAYEYSFVSLSDIHNLSKESIVVSSRINQFSRLRLRAEVIGSKLSIRYI
ncbi:3646_t:CDS:1, partial [Funneliformis caledonium]